MKVTLTRFTPDPVMAVEEAASQCYQSKPSPSGKIMKACYLSNHHSVLEHVSFTWHIEGVSRALLAQLTRHRIGTAYVSPCILSASERPSHNLFNASAEGFSANIEDSFIASLEVIFIFPFAP